MASKRFPNHQIQSYNSRPVFDPVTPTNLADTSKFLTGRTDPSSPSSMQPPIPIRHIAPALHTLNDLLARHEKLQQRLPPPMLLHRLLARIPLKHAHPILRIRTPQHKIRVRTFFL